MNSLRKAFQWLQNKDSEKMDFKRQIGIFNPDKNKEFTVSIVGCGSVGSFTALALAKMGVNVAEVFDSDTVEEHNIPNQFFAKKNVALKKVLALKLQLEEYTDASPTINKNIDKNTKLKGLIVVSAVDSIEARKEVWESVKGSKPMLYIDSRMGGRIFSVHSVDMLDEAEVKLYEEALAKTDNGLEVPCTERSIIFNVLGLASVVCNQVIEFAAHRKLRRVIHFDYGNYTIVTPDWEVK